MWLAGASFALACRIAEGRMLVGWKMVLLVLAATTCNNGERTLSTKMSLLIK